MAPKDGTTQCHRYWYCLRRFQRKASDTGDDVRSDEQEADVVEQILDRVAAYPFEIELLLADRDFYNERFVRRSRNITATEIPVKEKGDRMKKKLDTHCSNMTTYRMYTDRERSPARGLCVVSGRRPRQTR